MKINAHISLINKSKSFRLIFVPSTWERKRNHFSIKSGMTTLNFGGREAKMLHTFLSKIYTNK